MNLYFMKCLCNFFENSCTLLSANPVFAVRKTVDEGTFVKVFVCLCLLFVECFWPFIFLVWCWYTHIGFCLVWGHILIALQCGHLLIVEDCYEFSIWDFVFCCFGGSLSHGHLFHISVFPISIIISTVPSLGVIMNEGDTLMCFSLQLLNLHIDLRVELQIKSNKFIRFMLENTVKNHF